MRNLVIQLHRDEYHDFADYLAGLGFVRIVLNAPRSSFLTRRQLLRQYIRGGFQLLMRLYSLRQAGTVFAFGHFAYVVKLLARLRLVRYERLFCFGFFIQAPRWFPFFRWLGKFDRANDHYVIFSRSELDLYGDRLAITREKMHFVPLGDWSEARQRIGGEMEAVQGNYYFSGGRSNREYTGLISAFRSIPARLVIICSPSNWEELQAATLPPNVEVLREVPITVFDSYVRGARAGIISLRHDAGASGQSVTLALMRNAKCVIASNVAALRDYIEHGVSGFLVRDMATELPGIIGRIEADARWAQAVGKAAREKYEREFSMASVSQVFQELLGSMESNFDANTDRDERAGRRR